MADDDVKTRAESESDVDDAAVETATGTLDAESEGDEKSELEKLKEELTVETLDVGTLRKKLTITVPRSAIDRRIDEQYDELSNDAVVPGFRKGRAPRKLIEKRFGHDVADQIRTKLVGEAYLAAAEKEDLKTLGDPMILVQPKARKGEPAESSERLVSVQQALKEIELPDEGDLTLVCEVEVRPEFELPELKGIPVKRPVVTISDGDVDEEIKRIRATRGSWEPVADGPIEADDLVVADVKMTVDGETITEEENVQLAARAQRVEGVVLESLGDKLVGCKAGDVCTIEATVPDDHDREALRGKSASFAFTVQDLKRLSLPALDGEFLASLGFEDEAELRNLIKGEMEAKVDEMLNKALRSQVQQFLLDQTKLDLPAQLSQRQIDRAVIRRMVDMRMQGVPQEEIDKQADELRTSTSAQVAQELKMQFILDRVAEEQDVHVSEEELNSLIAGIARQYNRRFDRVRDELSKGDGLTTLYLRLRDAKILDRLLEDAEVTDVEGPAESKKKTDKKTTRKKKQKKVAAKLDETDSAEATADET